MPSVIEEIEKKLMALPATERACISEKLLSSLDTPAQVEIDRAWSKESEGRIQAYDQGELNACEDSEVYQRLEEKYAR